MSAAHILIVEPNPQARQLLDQTLASIECDVTACRDAAEGLERFAPGVFDVALIDIDLEGDGGFELAERLAAQDSSLVQLAMSARPDQATAVRAFETGADGFLNKPVAAEALVEKLKPALRQRRQRVEMRLLLGDLLDSRSDLHEIVSEQNRRLTRTERYLLQLLDAAPLGIVSTDKAGRILTSNGTARRLYGLAEDEMRGQPVAMLQADPEAAPSSGKQFHRRRDGETFPVLVRQRQIREANGDPIADLHLVEDLSERHRLEEQLLYAERLSLLGQLAPRIAHEFKTPLQLISGYIEMALATLRQEGDSKLTDLLEPILPATGEMNQLIQQIAELGKPAQTRPQEIDLGDELEKILDPLRQFGALKYCRVECDIARPLPTVWGDPTQLTQVFRNLIVNAAQAMERSEKRVLTLTLKGSPDGARLEASVADTGPGIPPELRERIFEPFFTTKDEGMGTGLGLAIVKTALERHGATIELRNEEGQGAVFCISLPTRAERAPHSNQLAGRTA